MMGLGGGAVERHRGVTPGSMRRPRGRGGEDGSRRSSAHERRARIVRSSSTRRGSLARLGGGGDDVSGHAYLLHFVEHLVDGSRSTFLGGTPAERRGQLRHRVGGPLVAERRATRRRRRARRTRRSTLAPRWREKELAVGALRHRLRRRLVRRDLYASPRKRRAHAEPRRRPGREPAGSNRRGRR